ncbi:MAG: RNA-binding protein [Ruminococcus sp.]|nr:RNA-binding protein [Ruminococcus sp.]
MKSENSEDKLLIAKTEDLFSVCNRNFVPASSYFLDERQCFIAESVCRKQSGLYYGFWGGYENAKRKILCVYNEYFNDTWKEEIGLKCLTFRYRKEDKLTHRDFLGSLMAMRLKRETIGDIIIAEGMAQVFADEIAAKHIMAELCKIGRIGVSIYDDLPFELEPVQEYTEISGTVSSLRLDSVLSLSIRQSREKSAMLIKSSGVSLNFIQVYSVSKELKCGDVFSVRGYGKFILSDVTGISKKGRIHITVQKYK